MSLCTLQFTIELSLQTFPMSLAVQEFNAKKQKRSFYVSWRMFFQKNILYFTLRLKVILLKIDKARIKRLFISWIVLRIYKSSSKSKSSVSYWVGRWAASSRREGWIPRTMFVAGIHLTQSNCRCRDTGSRFYARCSYASQLSHDRQTNWPQDPRLCVRTRWGACVPTRTWTSSSKRSCQRSWALAQTHIHTDTYTECGQSNRLDLAVAWRSRCARSQSANHIR